MNAATLIAQRQRQIQVFTAQVRSVLSGQTRAHGTAAATATATRPAREYNGLDSRVGEESWQEIRASAQARQRDAPQPLMPPTKPIVIPSIPSTQPRLPFQPTSRLSAAAVAAPLLSTLRSTHLSSPNVSPSTLVSSLRSNKSILSLPSLEDLRPPPPPSGDSKEKLVNTLLLQAIVLGAGALGLLRRGAKAARMGEEVEEDGPETAKQEGPVRAKIKRSHLDDGEGVMSLNLLIASYIWRPSNSWVPTTSHSEESSPAVSPNLEVAQVDPTELLNLVRRFSATNTIPDRFTLLSLLSYLYLPSTPESVHLSILLGVWRSFAALPAATDLEGAKVDQILLSAIIDLLYRIGESIKDASSQVSEACLEIVEGLAEAIIALTASGTQDVGIDCLIKELGKVASRLESFPVLTRLSDLESLLPNTRLELSISQVLALQRMKSNESDDETLPSLDSKKFIARQGVEGVVAGVQTCIEKRLEVDWARIDQVTRHLWMAYSTKQWRVDIALEAQLAQLVILSLLHNSTLRTSLSTRQSTHTSPDFLSQVIAHLVHTRHPRSAFSVFQAIPPEFRSLADYDALLSTEHARTSDEVWHRLLHHHTLSPTLHSLSARLKSHSAPSRRDLIGAHSSANGMRTRGVAPTLRECNQILSIAAKAGSERTFKRVRTRMIKRLKAAGLETEDAATRNIIMQREIGKGSSRLLGVRAQYPYSDEKTGGERVMKMKAKMYELDLLARRRHESGEFLYPTSVTTSIVLKTVAEDPQTRLETLIFLAYRLLRVNLDRSAPKSLSTPSKVAWAKHRRANYLHLIKAFESRKERTLMRKMMDAMEMERDEVDKLQ